MSRLNTELFKKIHEVITTQPDRHDQGTWESQLSDECGTARCVAGWAVHLTTGQKVFYWEPGTPCVVLSEATSSLAEERGVYVEDPEDTLAIPQLAAELLGIGHVEREVLFYSLTDRDAARAVKLAADGDEEGFKAFLRDVLSSSDDNEEVG